MNTHPTPHICVISDETGPHLDGFLDFAQAHDIRWVEVRSIDEINPLSLTPAQLRDAANRVRKAGLKVAGIATPLFKWPVPGQSATEMGDQFGFDRAGRSDRQLFEDAIAVADAFETRNMRIFSYLAADTFQLDDLKRDYEALLEFAERHDKVLRIENEHVCNIAFVSQLADVLEFFDTPRLEGIPDVANSFHGGDVPNETDIARVTAYSSHIHVKDFSNSQNRFLALGQGDVPTESYVRQYLKAAGEKTLTFSIETHVPEDPLAATVASVQELRRLLDTITT